MGRIAGVTLLFWLWASAAHACTICHSPTAMGVRHLLLEHDLARNAAAVATPIPILLAAILIAAREPARRRGQDHDA